jgi:hypothetical protein
MFHFEDGPDIETGFYTSDFSEITLTYGIIAKSWYIVSEERRLLLDGFIAESANSCWYSIIIRSCFLFFAILIYVLGSSKQIINDSLFHVMGVFGFQLSITSCVNRFRIHFSG